MADTAGDSSANPPAANSGDHILLVLALAMIPLGILLAVDDQSETTRVVHVQRHFVHTDENTPDSWRFDMTIKDFFASDRSLNGNHTPACALPNRGGVCDCWPPTTDAALLGPPGR